MSSTVNTSESKSLYFKINSVDRYSSSFRDRSTELQSHLTEFKMPKDNKRGAPDTNFAMYLLMKLRQINKQNEGVLPRHL